MGKTERENGSVTLETSIVLPFFILLFLFIYGIFSIIGTQNRMTHVLLQSARSLSLDSYLTENVDSIAEAGTKFWGGLSDMFFDIVRLDNDPYFSSSADWYSLDKVDARVIKRRFVGFLAGGNESEARIMLDDMHIVKGLDGVIFEVEKKEEIFTITMKYEIQYWFDFWGMGRIPMNQSIKTRLWK